MVDAADSKSAIARCGGSSPFLGINSYDPKANNRTICNPKINCWRKAYSEFGVSSKEAKSSVENLYRMVLSGKTIRRISPLVDIYNYVCLKHTLPIGGEDLDSIQGDMTLTVAEDYEPPVLLIGNQEAETPPKGEILYRDAIGVICRRWNWREAERTMLRETTKNAVLVVDAIHPISQSDVQIALDEMTELLSRFCGGRYTTSLLSKDNPACVL